jgi:hypothetical protein
VRFVNDEARSFIARNDERFDVIQISLIDTWAADRRRRLRAVRELALHRRGVGHLPVAPLAARPAQRVALVVQRTGPARSTG